MRTERIRRVLDYADAYTPGVMVDPHEPDDLDEAVYVDDDTDEPVLVHFPFPFDRATFRAAVTEVHFGGTYRTGMGFANRSRTFGYAPRKPQTRREACQATTLAVEFPHVEAILDDAGRACHQYLVDAIPGLIRDDRERTLSEVLPEWTIEDTPWTSGVINETSQLPYHIDGFNFPVWSAMPVVRRNVRGGHLHIPEYDITVPCRDGWVAAFPGYRLVHGVTPMTRTRDDGYRISTVFYALRGMKDCHTYAVELAEAQARRTQREDRFLTDDDPMLNGTYG